MSLQMEIHRDEGVHLIEIYFNYLGEFDYDVLEGPDDLVLTDDETIEATFMLEGDR